MKLPLTLATENVNKTGDAKPARVPFRTHACGSGCGVGLCCVVAVRRSRFFDVDSLTSVNNGVMG